MCVQWLLCVLLLLSSTSALANGNCGGVSQRECTVLEQIPSCDRGLTASGGKCHSCGARNEIPCAVSVQVPSCDGGLSEQGGRCVGCGREGEKACPVSVRVPSCFQGLVEEAGTATCIACGSIGEPPCNRTELPRGCDDWANLDATTGKCVTCGTNGRPPCMTAGSACKPELKEIMGRCKAQPSGCGAIGERPCNTLSEWYWYHRRMNVGCAHVPDEYHMGLAVENGTHQHVERGVCTTCGGRGQSPCSTSHKHRMSENDHSGPGCNGYEEVNGVCGGTPAPAPAPKPRSTSGQPMKR